MALLTTNFQNYLLYKKLKTFFFFFHVAVAATKCFSISKLWTPFSCSRTTIFSTTEEANLETNEQPNHWIAITKKKKSATETVKRRTKGAGRLSSFLDEIRTASEIQSLISSIEKQTLQHFCMYSRHVQPTAHGPHIAWPKLVLWPAPSSLTPSWWWLFSTVWPSLAPSVHPSLSHNHTISVQWALLRLKSAQGGVEGESGVHSAALRQGIICILVIGYMQSFEQ